jgi:predicted nucleotidyltransferase
MQRDRTLHTLSQLLPMLKIRFHVSRLGVFGSVARNEATTESDIDIIVSFDQPATLNNFMNLQTFLEGKLETHIDLVTENAMREEIKSYIEKDVIYAS